MSEDKMLEESSEWALRDEFSKWVFNPKSEGYPLRNPHDAQLAWKACAAIKDAEIAEIKKTAIYNTKEFGAFQEKYKFERQLLDGQIAARDLMIKELREAIQQILDAHRLSTKYAPDNVEDAEKQLDRIKKAGTAARDALAKSEHHNSRALDKMLLEARIDELKLVQAFFVRKDSYAWSQLAEMVAEREAKLAELNKE